MTEQAPLVAQVSKESACGTGDVGSILASGRCPGEGNGSPLQYSCLETPVNRGAWRATVLRGGRVGVNRAAGVHHG